MARTGSTVAIVAGSFAIGIAVIVVAMTVDFGHHGVSVPVYAIAAATIAFGLGALRRSRACAAVSALLGPVVVGALWWLGDVHGDDGYLSSKGEPSDATVTLLLVALLLVPLAIATFVIGIVGASVRRRS